MFLSKILAGDSSDRSPYGDFWFNPVTTYAAGGVRVTADTALQLSAVFRCVSLKSTSQAMLPFVLYKQRDDGSKQRITQHPIYNLFSIRPNRFQNRFEWREMLNAHIELRGNAFNQIISNARGEITELLPLHPDRMRMDLLDNGSYRWRYQDRTGTEQIFNRGEVWHLRGMSTDGLLGLSTIELARNSLSSAMSAQDYGTRFWANDAKPSGGWIEVPGKFKDDEARQLFRSSVQAAQGGTNRGKMMVLEAGMKYNEVGLSNEDAQFIETKKHNITDIARWFGVPPHKVGDLEKATFSNIEQQALEFIQDCLQPMCVRWESSIEADLLFENEGLKVEFDLTHLMRGDSDARAKYFHAGILDGWLTRNEARIAESYEPLNGLDEPLQPLNMSTQSASDKNNTGALNNMATADRAYPLASAAAERVARKELELIKAFVKKEDGSLQDLYVKHAAFVASVLNIEPLAAQAYCDSQLNWHAEHTEAFFAYTEADFMAIAQTKLESLAMKGSL